MLGFLPSATRLSIDGFLTASKVSIPCWVFSLLRHGNQVAESTEGVKFQSRAGFSPFCDMVKGPRTPHSSLPFQSRAGFSPFCDPRRSPAHPPATPSFNPVLGFLPSATPAAPSDSLPASVFQSRAGFSPFCDDLYPLLIRLDVRVSIPCWVFSLLRRRRHRPDRP